MKFAVLGALAAVQGTFLSDVITPEEYQYMQYVTEWGKSYGTKAEFKFRMEQFKQNLAFIGEHNSNNSNGHKVGLNQFADWTHEEYKKLLGYKADLKKEKNYADLEGVKIESSMDWRAKGAVTPVKNQGQCGSCWSFSTTGSVEGAMFLSTGKLQSFSEQQLVDCSKKNHGCQGGLMDWAFEYIETSPLMLESEYPYTAKNGKTCKYVASQGVGKVKSFKDVRQDSTGTNLMAALQHGPVSIAIEADQKAFQMYHSGIITSGCGSKLDHGVLAVGYGEGYILVKNSWGPSWGDQGYVKIAPSQCGITHQPSYPTE